MRTSLLGAVSWLAAMMVVAGGACSVINQAEDPIPVGGTGGTTAQGGTAGDGGVGATGQHRERQVLEPLEVERHREQRHRQPSSTPSHRRPTPLGPVPPQAPPL